MWGYLILVIENSPASGLCPRPHCHCTPYILFFEKYILHKVIFWIWLSWLFFTNICPPLSRKKSSPRPWLNGLQVCRSIQRTQNGHVTSISRELLVIKQLLFEEEVWRGVVLHGQTVDVILPPQLTSYGHRAELLQWRRSSDDGVK